MSEQLIATIRGGTSDAQNQAMKKLIENVGSAAAAELINDEIGRVLDLAQFTGDILVLADLRQLVDALKKVDAHRAAQYEEIARKRHFPGW